jgi:hypothetical protein
MRPKRGRLEREPLEMPKRHSEIEAWVDRFAYRLGEVNELPQSGNILAENCVETSSVRPARWAGRSHRDQNIVIKTP